MAIIIMDGENTERVEESNFHYESKLQEYIDKNPEIVPIYDIDEDTKLLVLAREFYTSSGKIDALGFDNKGNIYIIETKLYKNQESRRTVIAQALDYGASLWRSANNFTDFLGELDEESNKRHGKSFKDKYIEFFEFDDSEFEDRISQIEANLNEGIIKFVVLVDRLQEHVKNLAMFINQNSKFDLYLVELEYYKHDKFEILIPKLFGSEVKKEVAVKVGSTYQRRSWTKEDFISVVKELPDDISIAAKKVVDWIYSADSVSYGTGAVGSKSPKFNHINGSFAHALTTGGVQISYGYLEDDIELKKRLRSALSKHITFSGVTDIYDDKIERTKPVISADFVATHANEIIAALNEFVDGER